MKANLDLPVLEESSKPIGEERELAMERNSAKGLESERGAGWREMRAKEFNDLNEEGKGMNSLSGREETSRAGRLGSI